MVTSKVGMSKSEHGLVFSIFPPVLMAPSTSRVL